MSIYHPVPPERVGLPLDEFLCLLYPGVSKGFLRAALRDGEIEVVGGKSLAGHRIRMTDVIAVHADESTFPRRVASKVQPPEVLSKTTPPW